MVKKVCTLLMAVTLVLTAGCGAAPAAENKADTIKIVDQAGYEVTLPRDIQRIVVADIYPLPSILSVFLGSAEKIVGIHPNSMSAAKQGLLGELYPEILSADTGFMQGSDLNVEELMKLNPDVVFYSAASTELGQQLRDAGFHAVAISTSAWNYNVIETYNQWISLLSQIFPNHDISGKADSYAQEMLSVIQGRVEDTPDSKRPKVLFLFQYDDQKIITSGKNFFGQYWCDAVGAKNAAEEITADNANAVVNMEQIYVWNPDIIFITNFTTAQPEDLYQNKIGNNDWSGITAVKEKHVYKMPLGLYRSYTPGADTPVTLLWMAQKVWPDLFTDYHVTDVARKYYSDLFGLELTEEQVKSIFVPSSDAGAGFLS